MNQDTAKRQRTDGQDVASDKLGYGVAAMMAVVDKKLQQMQNEIDITKLRLSHQEDKCRSLEARCGLLERTVKLLTIPKNERWEYDVPEIPSNYWTPENGFHGENYAEEMERFLIMIKERTCALRKGVGILERFKGPLSMEQV